MAIGDETDFGARLRSVMPPWFGVATIPITDEDGIPLLDGDGQVITDGTFGPPIIAAILLGFATVAAYIYSLLAYVGLQTRIKTATGGWLDLIAYDFFGLRVQRIAGQDDASFVQTIIIELFRIRNTRAAYIKVLEDLTGRTPIIFEPSDGDPAFLNITAYWGVTLLGSRTLPFTIFITAFRGNGASDAQIFAAVNSVRTAGITAWVRIES